MLRRGRILLLLFLLLAAGCAQKVPSDTIWVGHVAPLSGPAKAVGEHERHGILLAIEEANRENQRVHGRRVAVQHADDRGSPEAAQTEAVRLLTVNRVFALLGGTTPLEAERLARTAQSYGVPAVVLGPLPSSVGGEGVLSLAASPAQQGKALGRFTVEKLKPARTVVVTDSRSPVSTELAAAFAREFTKDRPEEWSYQEDKEFPDLVKRLKKAAPDAVLIAAPARDFLKLAALIREAELKPALLYGGPEGELPALQGDRETSEGVYLATTYLPEIDTPANRAFVKQYEDHFHEPPDAAAALAHDSARLLFDAMRRARLVEAGEVRRELSGTQKFPSLTGVVTFGKDLHAIRPLFVAQLEKGRPKLVERYE
jgi:branched-chain amino acid transport system substrate-binding protein